MCGLHSNQDSRWDKDNEPLCSRRYASCLPAAIIHLIQFNGALPHFPFDIPNSVFSSNVVIATDHRRHRRLRRQLIYDKDLLEAFARRDAIPRTDVIGIR